MSRNHKLEIEYVAPRKWKTADGRFGVFKMLKPINPMMVTEIWKNKIQYVYSIRDLRLFDMPGNFYELASEIGRVNRFSDIFPWLGKYTGEGSFDRDNVEQVMPKGGTKKRIQEVRDLCKQLLFQTKQ